MEDNRDGIVVILAGYENEMKSLIESNPGFKSRIHQYYNFTTYNIEELRRIFEKMVASEGYELSEMACDKFGELIEPMRMSKHFGNGRTVRNIVQASIDKHKVNCMNTSKGYCSTMQGFKVAWKPKVIGFTIGSGERRYCYEGQTAYVKDVITNTALYTSIEEAARAGYKPDLYALMQPVSPGYVKR